MKPLPDDAPAEQRLTALQSLIKAAVPMLRVYCDGEGEVLLKSMWAAANGDFSEFMQFEPADEELRLKALEQLTNLQEVLDPTGTIREEFHRTFPPPPIKCACGALAVTSKDGESKCFRCAAT